MVPSKTTGIAQGIYGGWGNFGSAGAAIALPLLLQALVILMDGDMQLHWQVY